jgi:PAS domain S-box-containing protein
VQQELQRTQSEQSKEREAREQKLLKQRTVGIEMRQRARLAQIQASQEAQMEALRSAQNLERAALIETQANESHELTEMITGMIAHGAAWAPAEKKNRPWIVQLKKLRFRPSWELSDLLMCIKKLESDGGATARLTELTQKATALQNKETVEWYTKVKHTTLGEHSSSTLSQLVATHKIAQAKLADLHMQKIRLIEKQNAAALKTLRANFRLEKQQLVERVKQQQKEEEEAGYFLGGSDFSRRGSVKGSPMGKSKLSHRWRSHVEEDEAESHLAKPLDAHGKLLRVLWNDPKLDVLRSVLRLAASRRLFANFIEAKCRRDLVGLKLWEQVQHCKLLSGEERDQQAITLHDAHWAVASEMKPVSVNGSTALELLDQRAEATLSRLQAMWLSAFLEEHGESFVRIALNRPHEFAAIFKPMGETFLDMLSSAIEGLPFAVCCADMFEPGARLCCVNGAFEQLTGYEREYDEKPDYDPNAPENQIDGEISTRHKHGTSPLGRNCRFLQGDATDQEAVYKIVTALRNAQPAQIEVVNYRKNGSPFRNLLSLRPVYDSIGRYRYCIGLLADMHGWNDSRSGEINRLFRILPDSFDHAVQPTQFREPAAEDAAAADSAVTTRMSEMESRDATKVIWLQNLDRSLRALLQNRNEMTAFGNYVKDAHPEMLKDLSLLLETRQCSLLPRAAQVQAALSIAQRHFAPGEVEAMPRDALPQILQMRAGMAIEALATKALPSFLRSPASDSAVANVQLGSDLSTMNAAHLIWPKYTPPADAIQWLFPIVGAAENIDGVSICISDTRLGGSPLIYVNQGFCTMTGYSKAEVLGRNCRFLQGPLTEKASVAELVHALRTGADLTVKMTNYRRNGDTFENLLTVRAVHDSNGVYRFSVALQGSASASQAQLQLRATLVQVLARRIRLQQTAKPCGPYHNKCARPSLLTDIDDELAEAIRGEAAMQVAQDMRGHERYRSNHENMLGFIAAAPDRLSLTAVYWVCPKVMKQLKEALQSPHLSAMMVNLVPQIQAQLAGVRTEETMPLGASSTAGDITRLLVTPQHMPLFVDLVGAQLLHLTEVPKESDPDSTHTPLPTLAAAPTTTWIDMLSQATADSRFAVIVCDMYEPGARIVSVNKAFEQLTGHASRDVLGRNCRFLQGEATEQEAVALLVEALRNAEAAKIELTNYRKDGAQFTNLLSLQPVLDSNGRYRYCIGVLADVDMLTDSTTDELRLLCLMLPRRFESSAQPRRWDSLAVERRGIRGMLQDAEPQQHLPLVAATGEARSSYEARSLALAKLLWLEDMELSMRTLLADEEGLQAFKEYVQSEVQDASSQVSSGLKLVLAVQEIMVIPDEPPSMFEERVNAARVVASKHLDATELHAIPRESLSGELIRRHDECLRMLASSCLPGFVRSTRSNGVVMRVPLNSERGFASSSHLLWVQYHVAPDAMGWLYSVVSAVETLPVSVCVSDMRIAGNPIVYVNQAFSRMTGYSKSEVLGRNCRFLQGAETEVASVSAIVEAIRRGTDCTVQLTNYRRSGEMFENLLTIRPVHDSNGVYRFCVGAQGQMPMGRAQLELMHAFIELIPTRLVVDNAFPRGPRHQDDKDTPHAPLPSKSWGVMLSEAGSGRGSKEQLQAVDLHASVRFASQHTITLRSLGVYDPTRPFTRLMWFAEPLQTFRSLVP